MPYNDHEKNRAAWNELAEVHFRHPDFRVKEFLNGATTLRKIEQKELGDVKGKTLLHLMCQFGLDTLSWARKGAVVTGVDISDKSIEYANLLVKKVNIPATFIRTDVLELIGKIDTKFDIVFQSYGTHYWISDLNKWAETVAYHLKTNGAFYIVDLHPLAILWEEEDISYFKKGPYCYTNNEDYCDKDYFVKSEQVEWQHTLSDLVNSLIDAGLTIEFLNEFDKCCYPKTKDWYEKDGYYYPPGGPPRYPLMFSLMARKGKSMP